MGRHLLLVVEDTLLTRRKLILAPFFDLASAPQGEFDVELLRPDGSSTTVRAVAIVPFAAGPTQETRAHLALLGIDKESVPIGTAVWTVD